MEATASRISSRYSRRSLGIDNLAQDGIPDTGLQVCDWPQGRSSSTARCGCRRSPLPPELHQDVDVACRRLLVPHYGSEDADTGHAVAFPDNKQVLPDPGKGCVVTLEYSIRRL